MRMGFAGKIVDRIKRDGGWLQNEWIFGLLVIGGLLLLYTVMFARLVFSGEYVPGGDTYAYWSFNYLILDSIKEFNSLPWWDPTNYGGYPLYYHFISGWSNILSPYYVPSLLLFKLLTVFYDVSINSYIAFHRTVYVIGLNMIAIYLLSRELIENRIARVLPVFIFAFSYFQLLNFHDFYALEAMIAPLFFLFALVRFNNRRTSGNLLLFMLFTGLLAASAHYGMFMSAVFWTVIFTGFVLLFHRSLASDAWRLVRGLMQSPRGRFLFGVLCLLVLSGLVAAWLPFHFNSNHVLRYRGGPDSVPVNYDGTGGVTSSVIPIANSNILTVFVSWFPFRDIHDYLLQFAWHGHENRYIGLVTVPLILAAIILCLKNRYTYVLLFTYLLCNIFVIYATGNLAYKVITDNSDIFSNLTNMSTIFPRGGPSLFLIFLAGIGLDRLVAFAKGNEGLDAREAPFQRLFNRSMTVLMTIAAVLIAAAVLSGASEGFSWLQHSLAHIGIYLLIFSFLCRLLIVSNRPLIRKALLFSLFLLTFMDLTVSASTVLLAPREGQNLYDLVFKNVLVPAQPLADAGLTIPDSAFFKPVDSEQDQMFPRNYRGGYHNAERIHWGIREWLVLATRQQGRQFLPNWDPDYLMLGAFESVRMTKYPFFELHANGYYLPFDKIRELDSDQSIYEARPLFYLHNEQLVKSRQTDPRVPVHGSYLLKSYTPTRVEAEFKSDKDAFLYFVDGNDRFWSASVDGRSVPVHRANFAFKAIELPSGTHTVVWDYNPYPVKTAYLLFYAVLALCLVVLVRDSRNRQM